MSWKEAVALIASDLRYTVGLRATCHLGAAHARPAQAGLQRVREQAREGGARGEDAQGGGGARQLPRDAGGVFADGAQHISRRGDGAEGGRALAAAGAQRTRGGAALLPAAAGRRGARGGDEEAA